MLDQLQDYSIEGESEWDAQPDQSGQNALNDLLSRRKKVFVVSTHSKEPVSIPSRQASTATSRFKAAAQAQTQSPPPQAFIRSRTPPSVGHSVLESVLAQTLQSPFDPCPISDPLCNPLRDPKAFESLLQEALIDAKSFGILQENALLDKKNLLNRLISQVRHHQSSLQSDPKNAQDILAHLAKTLFYFIQVESGLLKHTSATLAYKVQNFNDKNEFAALEARLVEKEQLISRLERGQEKPPLPPKSGLSDSDTDVEDATLKRKKKQAWNTPKNFSLSDQDVSELANVLKTLDPLLPYPTPSNLLSSLKKLSQSSSRPPASTSYGNMSPELTKVDAEKYRTMQKEYRKVKSDHEQLSRKIKDLEYAAEKAQSLADDWKRQHDRLVSELESTKQSLTRRDRKRLASETEFSAQKLETSKQIQELQSQHASEIARVRAASEEELNKISDQAYQETKELQAQHARQMRDLQKKHDQEVEVLSRQLDEKSVELQKLGNTEREVEKLKKSMQYQHEYELDQLKSQSRSEVEKSRRDIEREYKDKITALESKLQKMGLETAKSLERELEANRLEYRKEQEAASLRHHQEMDRIRDQLTNEKNELKAILERTSSELGSIRQETNAEKGVLQSLSDSLSEKLQDLEKEKKDLLQQLKTIDSKFTKEKSALESDLNKSKSNAQDLANQLDLEKALVQTLKQDIADKEIYIKELGTSLLDYQKLHGNFEELESRFKGELQKKDQLISQLESSVAQEKEKAKSSLLESAEDKEYALDQLQRIKRRLAATEQDLKRAKEFTEEKETEILDLKRLLRSQNKQLETALGGAPSPSDTTSGSTRHRLEEALNEVALLGSQITTLKRQLESKDKEIFEVRIEASEAFDKASQLTRAQETMAQLQEEVDKLSGMLMELKMAKVQLMERVDNAEHRENVLKSEMSILKAELSRKAS